MHTTLVLPTMAR